MTGLVMAEMTALAFEVGYLTATAARENRQEAIDCPSCNCYHMECDSRHRCTVARAGELLDAMIRDHVGG